MSDVAIIATGGKQYLVRAGDQIEVEKLAVEPESTVDFTDLLNGKAVQVTVIRGLRDPKIRIVKFKSKVRYLRRRGHRQLKTLIRIESIK